jgi:hypothetical protein
MINSFLSYMTLPSPKLLISIHPEKEMEINTGERQS